MRFGIVLPLRPELAAEARLAEQLGFDSVFVAEHHQQDRGGWPTAPLVVLGALATVTERVRLGTGVLLLPLYHPIRVAEDGATVDYLSGGRLTLGVGLGYQEPDFAAFGVPMAQRVSRLEESIAVLRQAWTTGVVNHAGRRFQLDDVRVLPRTVQPEVPIWLAGWSEPAIDRAARIGDGWLIDPILNQDGVAHFLDHYRSAARDHGRPAHPVLMRTAIVGATREAAVEAMARPVVAGLHYYWRHGAFSDRFDPWLKEVRDDSEFTIDRLAPRRLILGSPADCIRQIEEWHAATGCEEIVLGFSRPLSSRDEAAAAPIRLFGERVIPHFR